MSANKLITFTEGSELWLGDWSDAESWQHDRLCVLEEPPHYSHPRLDSDYHVRILYTERSYAEGIALPQALDKAATVISSVLGKGGHKLLVHCGAGIERSPLTCAWWMRKTAYFNSLVAAYTYLMNKREVVEDRRHWLPPDVRLP